MPGAKQNNIKSKLEGMEKIPKGFAFNREASWRKVEEKLHANRYTLHAWPYAAAIVVLLTAVFIFTRQKDKDQLPVGIEERTPANIRQLPAMQPTSNSIPRQIVSTKKANSESKIRAISHPENSTNSGVETQVNQNEIPVQNKIQVPIKLDTLKTFLAIANTKPKFKIAHINELPQSVNQPLKQNDGNTTVFKRPFLATVTEEPLNAEEKLIVRKKTKPLFAPISASQ